MASWEDGPEYAPAFRPDHFAEPVAAPLAAAAPIEPSSPPAPIERPGFHHPQAPVAPLETLVPPIEDTRDPSVPFEVASASITEASSAWSAAHWSAPSGPPVPPAPLSPPAMSPLAPTPGFAVPTAPLPEPIPAPFPAHGAPHAGPFPAPGTTQWFQPAPAPYPPAVPAPSGPSAIAQAMTLGVIICLAIGGIVWPLAPIALLISFALASRVRAGRSGVLGVFTAVVSVLVVVGVVGALLSDDVLLFFSDWWELLARWAQVLCWVTLVAGWIVVWRALRTPGSGGGPTTGAGPTPTVWG